MKPYLLILKFRLKLECKFQRILDFAWTASESRPPKIANWRSRYFGYDVVGRTAGVSAAFDLSAVIRYAEVRTVASELWSIKQIEHLQPELNPSLLAEEAFS